MKRISLFLISIYQLTFGQLKGHSCRFEPTCSEYTRQAISLYGFRKGFLLGIKRLSKCHPFSKKDVFDPVPTKITGKQQ